MSAVNCDICYLGKELTIEQDYVASLNLAEAETFFKAKKNLLTIVDWDVFYLHTGLLSDFLNKYGSYPFPIFYVDPIHLPSLLDKISDFSFSAIVLKSEPETLQRQVLVSLEKLRLRQQEQELLELMKNQNKELEALSKHLKSASDQQKENVETAKLKVEQATQRLEAIQRLMVALYTADSIGEMESLLLEALRPAIDLKQIKLVLSPLTWSEAFAAHLQVLKFPILYDEQHLGDCYFLAESPWKKGDDLWLQQITEMIAVAVDRWLSLEQSLSMKENWEASFRSIQSKVAVIDENYNVLAYNQQVLKRGKCYKVLFHLDQPCYGCKLGKSFQITHLDRQENDLHVFEVSSQQQVSEIEEDVYVNVYEDSTHRTRQDRERVEAAKLAELGLIGSSIAHELNNPLSGVLSYIQILISEEPEGTEFYKILIQMEEGAKRCKQIIQNLLSFTRFNKSEEDADLDVQRLVEKALLFVETKAKTLGVAITTELKTDAVVRGSENLFIQAILAVLNNSLEEFSECLEGVPDFRPRLLIRQSQSANAVILDIIDNGRGIPADKLEKVFTPLFTLKNPSHNRGLGLTTAYQILQAMSGRIEIFSALPSGVQVRIVVPAKNAAH